MQTYIIRMGIKNLYYWITSTCKYLCQCKVTLSIRSRYSYFDITSSFSYIISDVRNLNDGPYFVKSVNNRVRGLSSP